MAEQCQWVHVAGLRAVLHQPAHQLNRGGVEGGLWGEERTTGGERMRRSGEYRAEQKEIC